MFLMYVRQVVTRFAAVIAGVGLISVGALAVVQQREIADLKRSAAAAQETASSAQASVTSLSLSAQRVDSRIDSTEREIASMQLHTLRPQLQLMGIKQRVAKLESDMARLPSATGSTTYYYTSPDIERRVSRLEYCLQDLISALRFGRDVYACF
jgi:chromosome segregation ATPase